MIENCSISEIKGIISLQIYSQKMATTELQKAVEAVNTENTPTIPTAPTAPKDAEATPSKPIHSLVLDTGPLIKNDPPVSTLIAQAHELYTLPSVISEIRDAATRTRVETTLLPFIKLRSPRPESIKFVTDFARRTGDLEVLSRPDLHLIALTYELECERNGGDWRLRKTPGQKGLNGKAPTQEKVGSATEQNDGANAESKKEENDVGNHNEGNQVQLEEAKVDENTDAKSETHEQPTVQQETVTQALGSLSIEPSALPTVDTIPNEAVISETAPTEQPEVKVEEEEDDDDDGEGWITPSNLKKHQAKDQISAPEQPIQKFLQVALLTSDYAMQNVALRVNLNLVSPSLARITRVKTWVLRCHGCFAISRHMEKQFCPRCGQPTLTRVSCSTNAAGEFTVHLKRNFQWNNRGNVYSVPKPVHGSANGKARGPGGGKGGWGRELIFAEDQKEYAKKSTEQKKTKQRDIMDEDYLPGILTGDRSGGAPGRIRVGAGRNVNSRKR
ncbi:D-site 20S pre-rRNA nuclease [Daldinia caldariorum]|uniref:D-site 20S pre-rRNA nuclease n=1 Tax=Daldinia caldariorum TaxID=326644 RepID=UPI002008636C|nr:D-site 20S pre-rRNA nuclease [Daldinia caldariorum]KAI1469845.1 D-site 20S pre-rRNA nuclease [Daldinia caldariorum]